MGAMYDFCKIMYGWMPGFDIDFYVKLGDAVLTKAGYKDITGKDWVDPTAASMSATESTAATDNTVVTA